MTPTPRQVLDILRSNPQASPVDDPDVSIVLEVADPLPTNPDHPFLVITYASEGGDYEHEFTWNSLNQGTRSLDNEGPSVSLTDTAGDEVHLIVDLDLTWS